MEEKEEEEAEEGEEEEDEKEEEREEIYTTLQQPLTYLLSWNLNTSGSGGVEEKLEYMMTYWS